MDPIRSLAGREALQDLLRVRDQPPDRLHAADAFDAEALKG